ncbi:TonB-dependent receptor plug domain-containing protein, partial [Aliarcobacter butzleri]
VYPTARGFSVDYYLFDGMPTYSMNGNATDPDLIIYDRVEVVKGANGLMTGAGNPAMGLNFIRKHANSKEFKGNIDLSAGSWDNYTSSADIQTP